MSDRIPEPPHTKRNISKDSQSKTVELSPHRITQDIRLAIDTAKMNDTWECELDDKDFNFLVGGRKDDVVIWENVTVYRRGKREAVIAKDSRTQEDLLEQEAEDSRLKRVEAESKPGRLKRPVGEDYHPKAGPKE